MIARRLPRSYFLGRRFDLSPDAVNWDHHDPPRGAPAPPLRLKTRYFTAQVARCASASFFLPSSSVIWSILFRAFMMPISTCC